MYNFEILISKCSNFSVLFPLLMGIASYKYLNKQERFFWYYMLVSFIAEVLLFFTTEYHIRNHYIVNCFALVETTMLLLFLYNSTHAIKYTKIILILIPAYLVFWCYFIFRNGITTVNSNIFLAKSLLLIIVSLYSLFILITNDNSFQISKKALFWIYIGIFSYFILTTAIYGLANLLIADVHFVHFFGMTNSFANIISNILYSIGLLCPILTKK
jgi:hypothetical protein